MSWDLYLVPEERAGNAPEWLESIAEEPGDGAAAAGHAAAVRARRPELETFEPDGGDYLELSAPEGSGLPVQVFLDGRHAAVSVAYWDVGERAAELTDLVLDVVGALRERTDWVAFDPQEDRIVAESELRASFLGGHEHGVELVRLIDASEQAPERPPRRRRRFFGLFGG